MFWKITVAIPVAFALAWVTITQLYPTSFFKMETASEPSHTNVSRIRGPVADQIIECTIINPFVTDSSPCVAETDARPRVSTELVSPTIILNSDHSLTEFTVRLGAFRAKWDAQRAPNHAAPWLYASVDCLRTGKGEAESCAEITSAARDIERMLLSEANSGNTGAQLTLGMHYLDRSHSPDLMFVDQSRLLGEAVRNLQGARDAGSETANTLLAQIERR